MPADIESRWFRAFIPTSVICFTFGFIVGGSLACYLVNHWMDYIMFDKHNRTSNKMPTTGLEELTTDLTTYLEELIRDLEELKTDPEESTTGLQELKSSWEELNTSQSGLVKDYTDVTPELRRTNNTKIYTVSYYNHSSLNGEIVYTDKTTYKSLPVSEYHGYKLLYSNHFCSDQTIGIQETISMYECLVACENKNECNGFMFTISMGRKNCYLKRGRCKNVITQLGTLIYYTDSCFIRTLASKNSNMTSSPQCSFPFKFHGKKYTDRCLNKKHHTYWCYIAPRIKGKETEWRDCRSKRYCFHCRRNLLDTLIETGQKILKIDNIKA